MDLYSIKTEQMKQGKDKIGQSIVWFKETTRILDTLQLPDPLSSSYPPKNHPEQQTGIFNKGFL